MKHRRIEVPYDQIEPETLRALIEEYTTRDGTFYGNKEMPMDQKIDMVIRQLETGEATITWDLSLQSGGIVLKKDVPDF
ncbi:YheU family protein [bacterium]|nr:YheU family protein [bacterium]